MRTTRAMVCGAALAAGLVGGVLPAGAGECGPEYRFAGVFGRTNGPVQAILALPNGDVVVGGKFTEIAGAAGEPVSANSVARWNGATWSALGSGLTGGFSGDLTGVRVLALTPAGDIIAGGTFMTSGGTATSLIARWNGTTWNPLGSGIAQGMAGAMNAVTAIAVLPSGDVIAGGTIRNFLIGGTFGHVYRWDGATWSALSGGTNGPVYALEAVPPGNRVVVGGQFSNAGGLGAGNVATWDAVLGWSAMGSGLGGSTSVVRGLVADGAGGLYASGAFRTNPVTRGLARWDGSSWTQLDLFGGRGDVAAASDGGLILQNTRYKDGAESRLDFVRGDNRTFTTQGLDVLGAGDNVAAGGWQIHRFTLDGAPLQLSVEGPQSVAVCPDGAGFVGQVYAFGRMPATYQWRRNGEAISLAMNATATSARLVVGDVVADDLGVYDCVVTTPCGTATSAAYTVTHLPAGTPGCGPSASCDDIDFNNNDIFPEDQDVADLFFVLAGGVCGNCNDIDFNNNGVYPEEQDVIDIFSVLAGGLCPS